MTGPSTATRALVPRHAATVVLLRERAGQLEVLLTQRAAGLAFMGGLWVFPGGSMDPADYGEAAASRVTERARTTLASRLGSTAGGPLEPATALGLYVAACRETFEECGVLLARTPGGEPCGSERVARLQSRREPSADATTFAGMLHEEDLLLDVAALTYWSHWITPEGESRRFDTRFFVVRVPHGQEASADRSELVGHAWLSPDDALARLAAGTMLLAPPTVATLEDLRDSHARHGDIETMLAAEADRDVPPILPKFASFGDGRWVVLPWDPDYATLPGEGCRIAETYPPYLARQPSRRPLPARVPGR